MGDCRRLVMDGGLKRGLDPKLPEGLPRLLPEQLKVNTELP